MDPPPLIFLSHAGEQSVVAGLLYDQLEKAHHKSVFFDKKSLKLGDSIYPGILQKLTHCRVCVVILSKDFVKKKWPMMELEHLIQESNDREGSDNELTIIPVFYGLKPADLTDPHKIKQWRKKHWENIQKREQDSEIVESFNVSNWEGCLRKIKDIVGCNAILPSTAGEYSTLTREIERVVSEICQRLPPPVFHFTGVSERNVGCDRIVKKLFEKMRSKTSGSEENIVAIKLGMYGVAGSGKSTICQAMVDFYLRQYGDFMGKSWWLELPYENNEEKFVEGLKAALKKFMAASDDDLGGINGLNHALTVFKDKIKYHKVFLAIDNVSDWSKHHINGILKDIRADSKVMVTSRSKKTLKFLGISNHNIVCVPTLEEDEACEAFVNYTKICRQFLSSNTVCIFNELYSFLDGCHPKLLFEVANLLTQLEIEDEGTFNESVCLVRRERYLEEDIRKTIVSALNINGKNHQDTRLQRALSDLSILFPVSDMKTDKLPQCNYICRWSLDESVPRGSQKSLPMDNFAMWRINDDIVEDQIQLEAYQSDEDELYNQNRMTPHIDDTLAKKILISDTFCNKVGNSWGVHGASHEVYSLMFNTKQRRTGRNTNQSEMQMQETTPRNNDCNPNFNSFTNVSIMLA